MKHIEQALKDFVNNEDIDEGNDNLRKSITNLAELRFALAIARQDHSEEYDEILDILISLN